MNTLSLLYGEFDLGGSEEARSLRQYKEQIEGIIDILSYNVNLREVKKEDIDDWEQELRTIVKGIYRLQSVSNIDTLLETYDGFKKQIDHALRNLYIASDILEQTKISTNDREKFYIKLQEVPDLLTEALIYFKI